METLITKATARDIHKLRRALETIDQTENDDARRIPAEWANVAHLQWNECTLAVRSDLLSKWTGLLDGDTSRLTCDIGGNVAVQQGQARLKLCAIDIGNIPPIYPIQVSVNGTIELACEVAAILAKATAIRKNKGAAKLAAKAATERTRLAYECQQYETAKEKVTPAL